MIGSPTLAGSERLKRFLRVSFDKTVRGEPLKESILGVEVFDRPEGYDTKGDPIVRVEARRLRRKLDEYYASEGAGDTVRFSLPKGSYALAIEPVEQAAKPQPRTLKLRWLVPTLAGGVMLLTAFELWKPSKTGDSPSMQRVTADAGVTFQPSVSRDGKLLAYVSDRANDGVFSIWLQPVSGGEPKRLTPPGYDALQPDLSPDGRHVVFHSFRDGGGIDRIRLADGTIERIAPSGESPRYSPDGQWILYSTPHEQRGELAFVIPAAGGTPTPVLPDFLGFRHPYWAVDGNRIVFTGVSRAAEPEDWWWVPFPDGPPKRLNLIESGKLPVNANPQLTLEPPIVWRGDSVFYAARAGGSYSIWRLKVSPAGELLSRPERMTFGTNSDFGPAIGGNTLYFGSGAINADVWSLPLDEASGRPSGPAVRVTSRLSNEYSPYQAPDAGSMAFASDRDGRRRIYWRDAAGSNERAVSQEGLTADSPVVSPDGKRVAYRSNQNGKSPVWAAELDSDKFTALCDDCGSPVDWSPRGNSILYESGGNPAYIGLLKTDSAEHGSYISHPTSSLRGGRFSPDLRSIAFHVEIGPSRRQIYVAANQRNAPPSQWIAITGGDYLDYSPEWSPSGDLLYFVSERSGQREIWAQSLDAASKGPAGKPFQVFRSAFSRQTLLSKFGSHYTSIGLTVRKGRMVFTMDEILGNIWSTAVR